MKKSIILLTMLILLTIVAYAEVESVTKIKDLGFDTSGDNTECIYYETENKLYCFSLPFPANRSRIWTYDIDTEVILNKTELLPEGFRWGDKSGIVIYGTKVWGYTYQTFSFLYDIPNANVTDLDLPLRGTGFCCDIDEGTDDVYCVGGNSGDVLVFKYEIDTGTFTNLSDPIIENVDTLQVSDMCDYDQTRDKLYYVGGWFRNPATNYSYDVYSYDVSGDTHSLIGEFPNILAHPDSTDFGLANGDCDYIESENKLYCYGMDDNNYQYQEIFYIDVTTGTSGVDDTLMYENASFFTCDRISETKTVCLGGYYGDGWDYFNDIFEIQYSTPPTPAPTGYVASHSASDISSVVIDFFVEFGIQIIAFTSIIALIGLYIWIKPKIPKVM